jgi:hypothetical protein
METREKNLKRAKAFKFRGFVNFIFSHDVKTAFAELQDVALHLNSAGKEVVENTGLLLNRISN